MKGKSIVLIGMAGAGKSAVGTSVAEALGCDFIDVDDHMVEKKGKALQEVIDDEGEAAFLQFLLH